MSVPWKIEIRVNEKGTVYLLLDGEQVGLVHEVGFKASYDKVFPSLEVKIVRFQNHATIAKLSCVPWISLTVVDPLGDPSP